uniref:Small ribosomal subunit protein uS4 N-terminal domain-containing protein n=1 Tax=Corvus moneduloides TaxID=1196302 RepID=A0A8U7M5S8_CORMO
MASMVRKLKYHEQKLLRRLDLVNWEVSGGNLAEVRALRRYRLGRREDYVHYKALARAVRALARRLRDLGPASAAFRARCAAALLEKLHGLGLVNSRQSLAVCESLSAAAFCRRRLPCLLVKLRMAQNLRHAVTFVEQGHVRVGPEVVTDPALLVPRLLDAQESELLLELSCYQGTRGERGDSWGVSSKQGGQILHFWNC